MANKVWSWFEKAAHCVAVGVHFKQVLVLRAGDLRLCRCNVIGESTAIRFSAEKVPRNLNPILRIEVYVHQKLLSFGFIPIESVRPNGQCVIRTDCACPASCCDMIIDRAKSTIEIEDG